MRCDSVFEEKHSLPGTECQPPLVNRNHFARSGEGHAEMARTVVRSFVGMNEKRKIFRDEMIKEGMKVGPCIRVRILHDDETRTGVLNEDGELARTQTGFGDETAKLGRDLVGPFAMSRNGELAGVGLECHRTQLIQ